MFDALCVKLNDNCVFIEHVLHTHHDLCNSICNPDIDLR